MLGLNCWNTKNTAFILGMFSVIDIDRKIFRKRPIYFLFKSTLLD